jgi:hypothetical protein
MYQLSLQRDFEARHYLIGGLGRREREHATPTDRGILKAPLIRTVTWSIC